MNCSNSRTYLAVSLIVTFFWLFAYIIFAGFLKVRTVAAKYIMKCDDDTFVRVDAVMKEVQKVRSGRSLYIGNINYYHRPLRHGKWAVTYEVLSLVFDFDSSIFTVLSNLYIRASMIFTSACGECSYFPRQAAWHF